MIDINKTTKNVTLEEKFNELSKEAIKDKQLIIKILQMCTENDCDLANKIFALIKNARKEGP